MERKFKQYDNVVILDKNLHYNETGVIRDYKPHHKYKHLPGTYTVGLRDNTEVSIKEENLELEPEYVTEEESEIFYREWEKKKLSKCVGRGGYH